MSHSKLATCPSACADSTHWAPRTAGKTLKPRHSATCLLAGARRGKGGAAEVVLAHALLQRLQLLAALSSTCRKHHRVLSTLTQSMQGQALNCFAPEVSPLLVLPHVD